MHWVCQMSEECLCTKCGESKLDWVWYKHMSICWGFFFFFSLYFFLWYYYRAYSTFVFAYIVWHDESVKYRLDQLCKATCVGVWVCVCVCVFSFFFFFPYHVLRLIKVHLMLLVIYSVQTCFGPWYRQLFCVQCNSDISSLDTSKSNSNNYWSCVFASFKLALGLWVYKLFDAMKSYIEWGARILF